jgi:hypothetical protein
MTINWGKWNRSRRLEKIKCWFLSHDWEILSISHSKNVALMHLHTLAGCAAVCKRCGKEWNDLPTDRDDIVYLEKSSTK